MLPTPLWKHCPMQAVQLQRTRANPIRLMGVQPAGPRSDHVLSLSAEPVGRLTDRIRPG